MNKKGFKILSIVILSVILMFLAYVYLPNVSIAVGTALDNVRAITDFSVSAETKDAIREHRGHSILSTTSSAETVSYDAAAGNTGISDINAVLSKLNDPNNWNLGWIFTLRYDTSVFCIERGSPFPNLNNKYLTLFHNESVAADGTVSQKKIDTNNDVVGTTHDDYTELWEALVCTENAIWALESDYGNADIDPVSKEITEGHLIDRYIMVPYRQHTLVEVNYAVTQQRALDPIESYIMAYSVRNYYKNNPAQVALWKHRNNILVSASYSGEEAVKAGWDLYRAAYAVNRLQNPTKPEISKTTDNTNARTTGTTLDSTKTKYSVGPFYMNQYTYGYSEYIKNYSGDSALKNPNNADMLSRMNDVQKATFQGLICGIVEAKVELDNGKIIYLNKDNFTYSEQDTGLATFVDTDDFYESPANKGYQFPTPNSKFYILLNISDCTGATYIKNITMKYKWSTADGEGGELGGTFNELTWENKWETLSNRLGHATYHCDKIYEGYECHNDQLDYTERSTVYSSEFLGNVNNYQHDFWCGTAGYCFDGKLGEHKHCCYVGYADITNVDPVEKCEECKGHKGAEKHKECTDPHHKATCKHTHNDDCIHHCGTGCFKAVGNTTIQDCVGDGNLDCELNETDYYCEGSHPHEPTCCTSHKEWSEEDEGCFKTVYCSDAVLDHCIHGFKDGKHKNRANKGWSYASYIIDCVGPDGVGTRCNCHPNAPEGGHANCYRFIWECIQKKEGIHSQSLMYISKSQVYEHNVEVSIGNIPLVCKVEINKYVYDVDHVQTAGAVDTTYAASDVRADLSNGQGANEKEKFEASEKNKKDNPVYVEFGDLVTFKILLKNSSEFGVKVRVDDTLPTGNYIFKSAYMNGTKIDNVSDLRKTIIVVPGKSESSFTVTIQTEDLQGTYANVAKIITRNGPVKNDNSDDVDYIRTVDDNGPVVNHIDTKCNGTAVEPRVESKDYYTLNNYNTFIDKYVYKYDQVKQEQNNDAGFTDETSVVDKNDILLINRENTNTTIVQYDDPKDDFLVDTRRQDNGTQETLKKEHPLNVEKGEKVTYAIKISNEAKKVEAALDAGDKVATQVRPTIVTDKMHKGLSYSNISAKVYKADGSVKQNSLGVTCTRGGTEGDLIVHNITLDNSTILDPGEYIVILVEAKVVQSNMYLPLMENSAELTMITNVNNKTDNDRDVTERNISENLISKEYVRMKDLVIAGKVWVDLNRDGLMNESASQDQRSLYGVDSEGMKNGVVVNLYRLDSQSSDNATKVRTTKTDADGFFTFSRDQQYRPFYPFNHTTSYDSGTYYQRIDKASGKDANGNYTAGSEYYRYYIEYEYDGVLYKSTEFYAGMNNLKQNDGRYDPKYLIDSNAMELESDRSSFNKLYEYISYDVAYDINKANGKDLSFNKNGHISTLTEDSTRKMTAKSFVIKHDINAVLNACSIAMNSCGSANWKQCGNHWDDWQVAISMGIIDESLYPNTEAGRKAAQAYLKSIYNSLSTSTSNSAERIKYLWLYSFNGGIDNTIPATDYLKYINLGLELREDVDIALSKDVYSVKTTIDGEEIEYSYNKLDILNGQGSKKDYIIDKPYGLELYESDYKKRTDQYASQAVRNYKGTESELNVEVTYRMTLNNIPVRDEYTMSTSTDTKLFVRVHELLDLYDQNFMTYSDDATVTVKEKDANGFLKNKTVKVSEAWYFVQGGSGTKYSIANTEEVAHGEKPFYIEDPNGTYTKVPLEVSNESSRGNGVYSNKANDFIADGYKTMYIRGMENIVLAEGEELDIYVKYTVDKDAAEVEVSSSYSETKSERSSSSININGNTYEFAVEGESSTSTNVTLHRALRVAEDNKNKQNGRGTENIAQINAYSVWYDKSGRTPASIVDVDSNAGNIGVTNGNGSKSVGSADDISLYEDTAYKTGIEIAAENTENDPDEVNNRYSEKILVKLTDLTRKITGKVWDDSRSQLLDTDNGSVYHGNGMYESGDTKVTEAQFNISINKDVYDVVKADEERTHEQKDLPVRSAKAEFVEIIQTAPDRYYEQVLTDVTWYQKQHDRTDEQGVYLLEGITPGRYIVRFTYGDTVDPNEDGLENYAEAAQDMQIFNGQDYKSTKYTLGLEEGDKDVDDVIKAFNNPKTSDARDDEMRRLTVNKYSEVMTNEKAEILKGVINNTAAEIKNRYREPGASNSEAELKALTDNTYMQAETIEFTVKPEKLLAENAYYRKATAEEIATGESKAIRVDYQDPEGIQVKKYSHIPDDIYYNALTLLKNSDIAKRAYAIYNLDFGIEYRPESQISLTKEINQMKLTAEDGTVLVDLYFDTTRDADNKTIHSINKDKSKGLEVVQFITNEYTEFKQALIKDIKNEEDLQGFVYVQVDDEILQGATVEISYKFYAQNNSEIDLIRDTLDVIRYKENKQTAELVNTYKNKGINILDTTYTASGTAENILFAEMYRFDEYATGTDAETNKDNIYRTKPKVTIDKTSDEGYYGRFVGYGYYTAEKFAKDVVASLKFDKILDYVDTNLEFNQETNNDNLDNRFWTITNPTELKPYVYALRKGGVDLTPVGALTNVDGEEYKALVVSVDDSLYDNIEGRIPDNADSLGNGIVNNKALSRFLLPEKADKTPDKTGSTGYIYLPTAKVIAAETDTDNLSYENIAEIIQFTTLTGRRTNFETTIGNANIHATKKSSPSKGSPEFETAALESDTAATETITLTPPTGLMLSRRKIVNVVDTAAKGVGITVIVAAVVAVAFGITIITKLIIKKRRIK